MISFFLVCRAPGGEADGLLKQECFPDKRVTVASASDVCTCVFRVFGITLRTMFLVDVM